MKQFYLTGAVLVLLLCGLFAHTTTTQAATDDIWLALATNSRVTTVAQNRITADTPDTYAIGIDEGQTLALHLNSSNATGYMTIYDPYNNVIASPISNGTDAWWEEQLWVAGIYRVLVQSSGDLVDYTLNASLTDTTPPPGSTTWLNVSIDDRVATRADSLITPDTPEMYIIPAIEGDTLNLHLAVDSPTGYLELYDPYGNLIVSPISDGVNAWWEQPIALTGDYQVMIKSSYGFVDYALTADLDAGMPPAIPIDLSYVGATTVVGAVESSLPHQSSQLYEFEAYAGEEVWVSVNVHNDSVAEFMVYDEDGMIVGSGSSNGGVTWSDDVERDSHYYVDVYAADGYSDFTLLVRRER